MKNLTLLIALFIVNLAFAQVDDAVQDDSSYLNSITQNSANSDFDLFELNTVRSASSELTQITEGTLFNLNLEAMSSLRTASPQVLTLVVPLNHGDHPSVCANQE